jgi:hypothetical protein
MKENEVFLYETFLSFFAISTLQANYYQFYK